MNAQINVSDYKYLLNKNIKVVCLDGTAVEGVWTNWVSEQDNEPDGESIMIDKADGSIEEIYVDEIERIEEALNNSAVA